MPVLDFIYFDAGGGHRAAATALKLVIEQQRLPWTIRLVNLQEVLDSLDVFRKVTGVRLQDIYNYQLKKGWTLGSAQMLPLMHGFIRLYHRAQVRLLRNYWSETKPDMVVSLVPNFNRAMWQALRRARPAAPYVTILTDFADFPPRFWMEKQEQYFICGTRYAADQALALGHSPDRVFLVSGMILHPRFYNPPDIDVAAERCKLGLKPGVPTGLVLFGGQGSARMRAIHKALEPCRYPLQLILICGRNDALARELRAANSRIPIHVEGFTSEVPYFMKLSDFFIGKPGPGSISEAVAMRLPVIVERNAWTLPQERYNTDWVREHGAGLVIRGFSKVRQAVEQLLAGELEQLRRNVSAIENRAVFEIPRILERLLPKRA